MREDKFTMNEYLEVNINKDLAMFCSDCYSALGWTVINTNTGIKSITLKLQRKRKFENRTVLCDLQRKCEDAFNNIEKLEKSKEIKPIALSLGIGILGTAFIAGATFAYLAYMIVLCVILAIVGFTGWILPYFIYINILKKNIEKTKPLIDSNYDVIYEACDKARELLLDKK